MYFSSVLPENPLKWQYKHFQKYVTGKDIESHKVTESKTHVSQVGELEAEIGESLALIDHRS